MSIPEIDAGGVGQPGHRINLYSITISKNMFKNVMYIIHYITFLNMFLEIHGILYHEFLPNSKKELVHNQDYHETSTYV